MNVFLLISIAAAILAQDVEIVAIFLFSLYFSLSGLIRSNQCRYLPSIYVSPYNCNVHLSSQHRHNYMSIYLANCVPSNSSWLAELLVSGKSSHFILLVTFQFYKLTHSQMKSHYRYVCVARLNISQSASKFLM